MAKTIDVASSVSHSYQDAAWFEASGIRETAARIDELKHLVNDPILLSYLTIVGASVGLMAGSVPYATDGPERSASTVAQQSRNAVFLKEHAERALKELRRQL
ncbi:hypothetical protein [Streptomyces sp. NPDC047972]|uniref:hypothetical protein n=1 Tax=Streptomyces sp. NPDC047972 TaxID=3365493 RepID=UPI003723D87D